MFLSATPLVLRVRAQGEIDIQLGRKEFKASRAKRRRAVRILEAAGFTVRPGRFIDTIRTDSESELHTAAATLRKSYRLVDIGWWGEEPVALDLIWPEKAVAAPAFTPRGLAGIEWPDVAAEAAAA